MYVIQLLHFGGLDVGLFTAFPLLAVNLLGLSEYFATLAIPLIAWYDELTAAILY